MQHLAVPRSQTLRRRAHVTQTTKPRLRMNIASQPTKAEQNGCRQRLEELSVVSATSCARASPDLETFVLSKAASTVQGRSSDDHLLNSKDHYWVTWPSIITADHIHADCYATNTFDRPFLVFHFLEHQHRIATFDSIANMPMPTSDHARR